MTSKFNLDGQTYIIESATVMMSAVEIIESAVLISSVVRSVESASITEPIIKSWSTSGPSRSAMTSESAWP